MKRFIALFLLFQTSIVISGTWPTKVESSDPSPPRIIRSCCALGSDLKLFGIPFVKMNQITSLESLNEHTFMGDKNEGIGLIYTTKGGFIDVAHVRDQADWTKYLYDLILAKHDQEEIMIKLPYEAGKKTLTINTKGALDSADCLLLSGRIAYDISLWHEISTWFGASAIPFIPERFSSFSVEDVYSNILGVYIGMEALENGGSYDVALTSALYTNLIDLGAVTNELDTYSALEAVQGAWWSRDERLPNKEVVIERDTDVLSEVKPWLLPDGNFGFFEPHVFSVPQATEAGVLLTDYYDLNIVLNNKLPWRQIFPDRENSMISEQDFGTILKRIEQDYKDSK